MKTTSELNSHGTLYVNENGVEESGGIDVFAVEDNKGVAENHVDVSDSQDESGVSRNKNVVDGVLQKEVYENEDFKET